MSTIKLIKHCKAIAMVLIVVMACVPAFSQDPGGNPDGPPPAVPFEDFMHLGLLAVGVVLALVVIKKLNRKAV